MIQRRIVNFTLFSWKLNVISFHKLLFLQFINNIIKSCVLFDLKVYLFWFSWTEMHLNLTDIFLKYLFLFRFLLYLLYWFLNIRFYIFLLLLNLLLHFFLLWQDLDFLYKFFLLLLNNLSNNYLLLFSHHRLNDCFLWF